MRKKIIILVSALSALFVALVVWLQNEKEMIGYVVTTMQTVDSETEILFIELPLEETEGKTRPEIVELIDRENKQDETAGVYLKIPWINKVFKTEFSKGDKMRVYWHGPVQQSGRIPGTSLILHSEYE